MHELRVRGELLDQRSDGWPEHPESGGNQNAHEIDFPQFRHSVVSQNGDDENDGPATGIEHHHEPPAVFAVNHYAGEGKHQQRRDGLQHQQRSQRHFRMRGLQDIPGYRGGVHPTADHGDDVCGKNQPQSAMLQNVTHVYPM